jgi:starch synthase
MYSLKYGALPVARATGGIQEIIEDYDPTLDRGYGFLFYQYSTEAFWDAIKRARDLFRDSAIWIELIRRAMARSFSWETAAEEYERVYSDLVGSDDQAAA